MRKKIIRRKRIRIRRIRKIMFIKVNKRTLNWRRKWPKEMQETAHR